MPGELLQYSLALACPVHGHSMDDLQPRDFSFNAPYGACPDCDGLGFQARRGRRGPHRGPGRCPSATARSAASSGTRTTTRRSSRPLCRHFGVDPAHARGTQAAQEGAHGRSSTAWAPRRFAWTTTRSTGATPTGSRRTPGVRIDPVRQVQRDDHREHTKARLEKFIREEPCPTLPRRAPEAGDARRHGGRQVASTTCAA